jgi:hypothetical protein
MDGILVTLREMRLGQFFLGRSVVRTGLDIPMLRLVGNDSEDFYAGPGISVPAVDDLLADPDLKLFPECSNDFKEVVFRNGRFEIDVFGNQDRDEKILQVGFHCQDFAAGIDIALKKKIEAFVPLTAGNTLKAEKILALKIQMPELIEVQRTIFAGLRILRVAYHAGRIDFMQALLFRLHNKPFAFPINSSMLQGHCPLPQ